MADEEKFDTDRYCTPPEGLSPVREYWPQGITLDPCGDPDDVVGAIERFDVRADQDGLYFDWANGVAPGRAATEESRMKIQGQIFMNPPYSKTGNWTSMAVDESLRMPLVEIIGLLPAATDAHWWHTDVLQNARAICYRRGRLKFLKRGVKDPRPRGANAYVLWGGTGRDVLADSRQMDRFRRVFSRVGHVEVLS